MELAVIPVKQKFMEPVRRLYLESFPEEERRPWEQILKGIPDENSDVRGPYLHLLVARQGLSERFLGFFTMWYFDEFCYIEHLAIMPACRNQGIGQAFLEDILENLDVPVVLEIERPGTSALAERRLRFYQRTGFHALEYDYIQPPYGPGLPEVPMTLMSSDPSLNPATIASILHERVYANLGK